jgi:hypothetical protein
MITSIDSLSLGHYENIARGERLIHQPIEQFPPLELVTKPNLTTAELAHYLNRRPQTLRGWACHENGPLRPKRIHGILAWSTAETKALVGVSA